jgi:hypothetical protein
MSYTRKTQARGGGPNVEPQTPDTGGKGSEEKRSVSRSNPKSERAAQRGIVHSKEAQLPNRSAGLAGAAAVFASGNGRLLTAVRVHLIFWGNAWTSLPAAAATVGQCTDAVLTILESDYMRSLGQYGIGSGGLGSVTVVSEAIGDSPADPPNPFSNDNVWQLVENLRRANRIPTSDIGSSGQGLYCVILPAGVASDQPFIGEHSYYWFDSTNVPFAWITQNSLDGFSEIFSHELVEACTDPEGTGWTSTTACGVNHSGWCEIGDVCEGNAARVNGVLVQRYWSNSDNQCVIPDDPKVVQDSKNHKDSKDTKDHKDHKDQKETKDGAKESHKEIKDGAKEIERPPLASGVVEQLRHVVQQLTDLAGMIDEGGTAEAFIAPEERPPVGGR